MIDRLLDLMGGASRHVPDPDPPRDDATLRLAERLLNLGDVLLEEHAAPRLIRCATNVVGWRCGMTSICPRCARRQAIRDRLSLQSSFAGLGPRALVTRTAHASTILEGHRAFVLARRVQGRSASWRSSFWCGRGRIDAKASADGGWLVHSHEVVVVREPPRPAELDARWKELVGAEGLVGNVDVRPIDEGGARRRGRSFRRAVVLRDAAREVGAPGAGRRRAPRMVHGRPSPALGNQVRARAVRAVTEES